MIKAIAGDLLILAITEENVTLMRKGDAIYIDLAAMGNPKFTKIAIDLSSSPAKAMEKFAPFIGPDTRVHGKEN